MNLNKVKEAKSLIEKTINHKNPRIAYSGGKDSLVVLHLVRSVIGDHIKAVFCNTGVEYPETVSHCRSIPNLDEVKYIKSFWECIDKWGWPGQKDSGHGRHGNMCCYYMKELPGTLYYKENNVDLVYTGLTMDESRNRMMVLKRMGPYYYMKTDDIYKCHPIYNWSEEDVWDYIHENNLEYNKRYDMGSKRIGCIFCTAYLSWRERLAKENPKALKIILKKRGWKTLLEFTQENE